MKPLITKKTFKITQNHNDTQRQMPTSRQENHHISDDGSGDSTMYDYITIRDCSCNGPTAGICYICKASNCANCLIYCANCSKPVCSEHYNFFEADDEKIKLCDSCFDKRTRKRRNTKIKRLFLSLLFDLEK